MGNSKLSVKSTSTSFLFREQRAGSSEHCVLGTLSTGTHLMTVCAGVLVFTMLQGTHFPTRIVIPVNVDLIGKCFGPHEKTSL